MNLTFDRGDVYLDTVFSDDVCQLCPTGSGFIYFPDFVNELN